MAPGASSLSNQEKRLPYFLDLFALLVLYSLPSSIYIYQQISDQPPIRVKIGKSLLLLNNDAPLLFLVANRLGSKTLNTVTVPCQSLLEVSRVSPESER